MHNLVKMLRSTELYALKKWILSCFLKFKNKSKYNGKDCSAECSLLATKGRLRVGIPAVLSSKNPIHQLIKAKRFFERWEGGREDVISKLQAELSPHTQCIQILSSFHLPSATSLAWSSPLSPERIWWQPFDSSPTSTLVPSRLFSTQQLLSSWKCVSDHLTLLLKPFNDFLTLGFYLKAYKAQQWTGPVTPLASSPTTPALTAFFLFLKHAKVKHAQLIPPQGLCIVFSASNALPLHKWMAHYVSHDLNVISSNRPCIISTLK